MAATSHDLAVPGPAGPFWAQSPNDLLAAHRSDHAGLDAADAAERRRMLGPNTVERPGGHRGARLFAAQFASPGCSVSGQELSAGRAVDALPARCGCT